LLFRVQVASKVGENNLPLAGLLRNNKDIEQHKKAIRLLADGFILFTVSFYCF